MDTEFTLIQKRALAVCTVIALAFGAYFLRGYFMLIVVAAIAAYLFTPLFDWLNTRFGRGLSATLTLLAAIGSVIVPVGLLVVLAVVQISHMITSVTNWIGTTDVGALGDRALREANRFLSRLPFSTAAQHVARRRTEAPQPILAVCPPRQRQARH